MNKNLALALLLGILLGVGGGLLVQPWKTPPLGRSTDETNVKVFLNTVTAGCLRVYQLNATTNASTTYYLVASTTAGGAVEASGFPIFATNTKPTNCP